MGLFDDLNSQDYPEQLAEDYVERLVPTLALGVTQRRLAEMLVEVPNRALGQVVIQLGGLGFEFRAKAKGIPEPVAQTIKAFERTVLHYMSGGSDSPEPLKIGGKVIEHDGKPLFTDPPPFPEDELIRELIVRGREGESELQAERQRDRINRVVYNVQEVPRIRDYLIERGEIRWLDGVVRGGPFERNEDVVALASDLVEVLAEENAYLKAVYAGASREAGLQNPGLTSSWNTVSSVDPRIAGSQLLQASGAIFGRAIEGNADHVERSQRIGELGRRLTQVHPRQIFQIASARLAAQGEQGQALQAELRDLAQRWQDYQVAARLSPDDLREALANEGDSRLPTGTRTRLMEHKAPNSVQVSERVADIFQSAIFGVGERPTLHIGDRDTSSASAGLSAAVSTMRDASRYMLQYAPQELSLIGTAQAGLPDLPR